MFDSSLIFEDELSRRLARMHAFALFMSGDRESEAEDMVVRASTNALEAHFVGEAPDRALIAAMVRECIESLGWPRDNRLPPAVSLSGLRTRHLKSLSPSCVRRAAAVIPTEARAAIWLVAVDRRTYGETARLLGVDEAAVSRLLEWRDVLIRQALDEAGPAGQTASGNF